MKRHTQARGGFTLIELLVTISIIAVVSGLIVGGTMAFRETMTNRATEDRFNRLQGALNKEYGDVVQKGNSADPPKAVVEYCGGDKERARAVHTAALLRVALPETFEEATTGFNIGGYPYEAKPAYQAVKMATVPTSFGGVPITTADMESAVLLHLILTERSQSGTTGDSVGPGETTVVTASSPPNKTFTVVVDSRGMPVAYRRWARNDELDGASFAIPEPKTGSIDPLDPRLLVFNWSDTARRNYLNQNMAATDPNLKFTNHNRLPTLISFGKNKTNDTYAGDDVIGYRLNRYGKRGK